MEVILNTDTSGIVISKIINNLQECNISNSINANMSAVDLVAALNIIFGDIFSIQDYSETFIEKLNTAFNNIVPSDNVYLDEITNTVNKIKQFDSENSFTFFLCTDIHYSSAIETGLKANGTSTVQYNYVDPNHILVSVENMKKVLDLSRNDITVDAIFNLGDIDDGGHKTIQQHIDNNSMILNLFKTNLYPKLFVAVGNHDDNKNGFTTKPPKLTVAELESTFIDDIFTDNDNIVYLTNVNGISTKLVYYKDFDGTFPIRAIFIYGNNSTYINGGSGSYGFASATKTFLQNSLETLNNRKAIIISHVPYKSFMFNRNISITGTIDTVIKQYSDSIIGVFYGHCHSDNVWADPVPTIGTGCTKVSEWNGGNVSLYAEDAVMPIRHSSPLENRNYDDPNYPTIPENDLWDIVNIDSDKITTIRFGAGADRIIHYVPLAVSSGDTVEIDNCNIIDGIWGCRTSDFKYISSIENGVITLNDNIPIGKILSIWCKSSDWNVNQYKQYVGSNIEYWSIKIVE